MDPDYKKLGFKCGMEWHQQLGGRKLFCNCLTSMKEENFVSSLTRKIRSSIGETGNVDIAAAFELSRNRTFVYNCYKEEACLVDIDEQPPFKISREALKTALEVATLLKMYIPDKLCIMRKTVTDGSTPTSFQRTMIIGLESKNSFLSTSQGKVKLAQLNLEEDAGKKEKEEGTTVTYSLSRLGVPLLELGTAPDIVSPEHALEVAEKIGLIFRSFALTKRGIGTIRQDVNVSIKNGSRIEIKGWQDLKTLPDLIKNEVIRQKNLLEIKGKLEKNLRKIKESPKDVTALFKNSKSKVISKDKQNVIASKLPFFSGLLKKEICPGKTFGKELAEYAMSYGVKGIIHSDEDLGKYDLEQEFLILKDNLRADDKDVVFIVAGFKDAAERAVNSILERAQKCLEGIPEETRVPNHFNATSSYARPLPGANRMYPETDLKRITVDGELLADIEIPELIAEKALRFEKQYQLRPQLAREIAKEFVGFEDLVKKFKNINANLIANIVVEMPKDMKKRLDIDSSKLGFNDFEEVLGYLGKGYLNKDAVFEVLCEKALGKNVDLDRFKKISNEEIENVVKDVINQNKGAPFNALMGIAMERLRGKADGKVVSEIIKKLI